MEWSLLEFVLIGFLAQVVDGALGMGYGVLSMVLLLNAGIAPAPASASVHVAEIFTTGMSGISHLYNRNVERRLLWSLAVPGMAGAALGAIALINIPADVARPLVATYLAGTGALILYKFFRPPRPRPVGLMWPPGFAGGFLDASGGGGWGSIVGATLIARGQARLRREAVGKPRTDRPHPAHDP